MAVTPALRNWMQEEQEFKTSLGNIAKPHLINKPTTVEVRPSVELA